MARMIFGGGTPDTYLYEDADGDLHAGGGLTALFFTTRTGSTQHTNLLTMSDVAISSIDTSDGSDDYAPGTIPQFKGPDGVFEMWVEVNGSARFLMTATNLGSYLGPIKADIDDHIAPGNTNPHGTTLVSLLDVDEASVTAGATGSTLVKNGSGQFEAGNAPVPMTDIVWVAADDAPSQFTGAPYVCDGTADDVQIQLALTNSLGLKVGLSPGTFNLAAPINLYGADDLAVDRARYLVGCGPASTILAVGSSVTGGIFLGQAVMPHVSDLTITVASASHGIYSTRSTTTAASNRSFYNGTLRNIVIKGPGNGTHTGWGMSLGSAYRSVISNVSVTGTGNGIKIAAENSAFHPGECVVMDCSVNVAGTNAVAYQVNATSGDVRHVAFVACSAVVSSSYTGTTAWKIDGAANASHIRIIAATAAQFATTISTAAAVDEIDADFGQVTQRTGSTFVAAAGFGSRFRCGELIAEASATVTAINETNATATSPNTYDLDIVANTSSTVSATLTTGAVIRSIVSGAGTVANALRQFPNTRNQTLAWSLAGSLSGLTGTGKFSWTNPYPTPVYIRSVYTEVDTAPTGATILVDVNIGGTTVFTTQSNRPTIAISGTNSGFVTNMDVIAVAAGAKIRVDLDQVGSSTAGSNLTILVRIS